MRIPLTGVTDQHRLRIPATNVGAASGGVLSAATLEMRFMLGDTNGDTNADGTVNSGDVQQTRNRSGQVTEGTNFRSDVNRDGTINSGDAFIVRGQSGKSVP